MLLTELPRHLFDALRDANKGITTGIIRRDHPSEVMLGAPLDPWFGEGNIWYKDFGGFEVTLYPPGGGQFFSVSVHEDGSSVFASTGESTDGLDLNLPISRAVAKMLVLATQMLHESPFEMSEQGKQALKDFFGDPKDVATPGVGLLLEKPECTMTRQTLLSQLFDQFRDPNTAVEEKEWAVDRKTKVAQLAGCNGSIALHQLVTDEFCLRICAAKVTALSKDEDAILTITTHFSRGLIFQLGGISGLDLITIEAVKDLMPTVISLLTAAIDLAQTIS